jgi:hypothetical protein
MDEKVTLWMKQPKLWKLKNTSRLEACVIMHITAKYAQYAQYAKYVHKYATKYATK